jgi:hypothetical protein
LPFKIALEKIKSTGNNIWMIRDHIECDMVEAKKSIDATTLLFKKSNERELNNESIDASFSQYTKLLEFIEKI